MNVERRVTFGARKETQWLSTYKDSCNVLHGYSCSNVWNDCDQQTITKILHTNSTSKNIPIYIL